MKPRVGIAKRLLIDVGVGIGIITFAALLFAITLVTGKTVPFNWIEFVGMTPIVFWLVVKQFRRYWHRPSFWFAAAGLLAIHGGFFTIVLIKYPEWPGIWFVPVSILEAGLLFMILNKLVVHHSR
ncbi:MAG: hypothetical protein ACRD1J_07620 [Terriglobia bacterium]